MSRTHGNEKSSSQFTTSVKPIASFLQTRDFAPLQTDLDEDAPLRSSGYSENFLEKIINQRSTESSNTPVQAKPMNRLKTLQAQRMGIQAKLNIGEPNDKYEREADHTAVQVVQQINSSSQDQQSVQRDESMESEEKEEEELQMKPDISQIQRHESMEEESEDLQMKSLVQRKDNVGGGEASSDLESSIEGARGGGQSLDSSLQEKMGVAMGADFSGVKVHTDSQSDQLNRSIQAKAFTTGQDLFFRQGAYEPSSRGGQELIAHELTHVVQQNGGAVQRQVKQNSTSINTDNTNSSSTQSLQREFDPQVVSMLEKHIGSKASQQKFVSGKGHGQGMAEQLARGGDGQNENVDNFTGGEEAAPEVMSQTLMNLVRLTQYDDTASASVLEMANGGQDLQDEQMWNLIVVNSKFMSYIQTGMTINKIIPDSTVQNVLNIKQNDATYGTSVGGSVAHEKNYNQGLTGEEATANFGLDYGGYQAGTLKANGTEAGASAHSSYVYDTAADDKGRTLKAVPNVFYMKIAIPENKLADVKVPVHGNVKSWAESKLLDIQTTIGDPVLLPKLVEESGAKDSGEMLTSLSKKVEILTQFIARAKVDQGMLTTLTADQKKNKEDPLTNMGMTKPSSRLQTSFGTVNQEYHIGYFPVPEGSGLWLKDATGVDTLVGQFIPNPVNSNKVEWGNLNDALIGQKLSENEALRT